MRIFKKNPLLKLVNSYLVDSPQPANLNYWWNFGSLLALSLIIQIITGVTLAMHYSSSLDEAFDSVEHIMRDINNGWLIRYLHSNTASAFFFIVYLHIGRGLYYGSYKTPRTLVWALGTVIFIIMMATAFLGYVLPFGQMSLWGATVITSLMSAIPWIGQDIVEFIWGGFSVNGATLNRFFALHFLLPFTLAALALAHLISLHDRAGSGNPLGVSSNSDKLPFAPYYIFKDLITIFIYILVLSIFVFYMPNVLGDSENYVVADPMKTPSAIVPEWYLLSFYAILRSIPNKLLGVIAMFSAILMLVVLSTLDWSRSRGLQFKPLGKTVFFLFVGNFIMLTKLGAEHVEFPFIELGQICTLIYFSYFLLIVPAISYAENGIIEAWTSRTVSEPAVITVETKKSASKDEMITKPTSSGIRKQFKWELPKTSLGVPALATCSAYVPLNFLLKQNAYILGIVISMFYVNLNSLCDAPRPWGLYFQDAGTPQMEAIIELHNNIMYYLIAILLGVAWLLTTIIRKYNNNVSPLSKRFSGHGTSIEIIWTVTPALILILLAFPSFKLLYLIDEVLDPNMVIYAEGHQWYWTYQFADFTNSDSEHIEYDSYLTPELDLKSGALRMLDVDNRVAVPELTHIRFIVAGADVIHSFACPSLGLKCDAYPGRLSQSSLLLNRASTFYGQCSEICGILHSAMPIVFEAFSIEKFIIWLKGSDDFTYATVLPTLSWIIANNRWLDITLYSSLSFLVYNKFLAIKKK